MEDLAGLALTKPDYIPMLIKSFGGDTDEGFELAHFIEFDLGVPVHATVAYSHSASTYSLLCCAKRTGRPSSHFVLHHQTSMMQTQYNPREFDNDVDAWKLDNHATFQRQLSFYMRKLNISEAKAAQILADGSASINNRTDAETALELGILTEIKVETQNEPPS